MTVTAKKIPPLREGYLYLDPANLFLDGILFIQIDMTKPDLSGKDSILHKQNRNSCTKQVLTAIITGFRINSWKAQHTLGLDTLDLNYISWLGLSSETVQ